MNRFNHCLASVLLSTVLVHSAVAQTNEQSAEPNIADDVLAQYENGLQALRTGAKEQAYRYFQRLIEIYNSGRDLSAAELVAIASGASKMGASDPQLFKDAVRVFDEAIAEDPNNMDARIELGNLLLQKYNNKEAQQVFQETLLLDPDNARALLGLARSQHFDHSADALETVNQSLRNDPTLIAALVFRASLLIELEQYDAALAEVAKALAIDPQSLEALAIAAAVHYLSGADSEYEQTVQRITTINAHYAELYNALAELAARNRFYGQAVKFAEQAIALDAQSWRAYGLLGTNQLRVGEIDAGLANLQRAFSGDPYNVWIKNTLDLADTFSEYEIIEQGRFQLLLHKDEAPLLADYVMTLAEQAYEFYSQRYQYHPPTPIRIEFYPRHADFSVRTVGLAGVGILGVSFGPVVAMDSPSARKLGHFNWGSTLWHEIAHTFHLAMSDQRVPRWFSEGLSVYEERQAQPGWGGDVSADFLLAYKEGRLLPVSELNNGFVRPSYPEQVIFSYYQASLVFDFIVQDWGFDAVLKMLAGFKNRLSTNAAISQALHIDIKDFDRAFDFYFRQRFATQLRAIAPLELEMERPGTPSELLRRAYWEPEHFALQLQAGRHLLKQGELLGAEFFLRRAKALFPDYGSADSPYWYLAQLHEKQGALLQAIEHLRQLVNIDGENYHAHIKLADLLRIFGDSAGAAKVLQRANYIYPYEIDLHQRLADLYTSERAWSLAAQERRAVIALNPVDMAGARYQLARAYFQHGDRQAAKQELLRSLEIAPNFVDGLELLLEIREH